MKQKVFDILDELWIDYKNYEHQAVHSCLDAKWIDIPWLRVKSLLIRNKKATNFYMVVVWDNTRLDTNKVREFFWDSKMSFVDEVDMIKKIWLKPWSVSPFALINNIEKDIKLVFDKKLEKQIVWFHPLQNDNTVVLHMDDVLKYVEKLWFEYSFVNL